MALTNKIDSTTTITTITTITIITTITTITTNRRFIQQCIRSVRLMSLQREVFLLLIAFWQKFLAFQ
jgi:hypothetical protein